MENKFYKQLGKYGSLRVLLIVGSLLVWLITTAPLEVHAEVASWQKGASIISSSSDAFASDGFRRSMDNLRDTGASVVTFIIPYYQSSTRSSDIARGWNTPTDTTLGSAIDYANSIGLQVVLKPHLDAYSGEWRAEIDAEDRDAWFANYEDMILHYADIANKHNVVGITIGTELVHMSTYTSNPDNTRRWQEMISNIRAVYSGFLTYSANWGSGSFADEKSYIGFWGDLDYIGISAYFDLVGGSDVSDMKSAWDSWRRTNIEPLHDEFNKPILFTEIGYRSVEGAHDQPWYYCDCGTFDEGEQARAYEALFSYWDNYPYMQGVYLWNWYPDPNAGGQGNLDYTPQNKQAEDVMRTWFTNSNGDGNNSSDNDTDVDLIATGSVTDSPMPTDVTVEVELQNMGRAINGAIVDLELYQGDSKVGQEFFGGESLSTGAKKTYRVSFSPGRSGEVVLKLGVFTAGWQKVIYWDNEVLHVDIKENSGGGGAPPTGEINIWWPSDGSYVSGMQRFKAQLMNKDISQYAMYWQVGDGQLNIMFDSYEDYPHKEVMVDLSGWRWEPSGKYDIYFVAKDSDGNLISKKGEVIYVTY